MSTISADNLDSTFISKLLSSKGINRIAIVDDAFDPLDPENLQSFVADFWVQIEHDEAAMQDLRAMGIAVDKYEDINASVLQQLDEQRNTLTSSKDAFESTIGTYINEIRSDAYKLRDALQNYGVEVNTFGSSPDPSELKADIAFVDYFLDAGPKPKGLELINLLRNKSDTSMPLIVLMSSKPELISNKALDDFKNESGLIGGMFHYVPKNRLLNPSKLPILIGSYANRVTSGATLQSFVDQIAAAIEETSISFLRSVRSLSLEDYAYIQRLSLYEDGHPLGDYMMWLYSSYFGYLLFECADLKDSRDKLDALQFAEMPPSQIPPSDQLTNMYKSALFDKSVSSIGIYPVKAADGQISMQPYIHLGDIYANREKDHIWMVISAQCDLSYSLSEGRQFDAERSIIFIHGELQLFQSILARDQGHRAVTEPLELDGINYRIQWNTKKIKTLEYGSVNNWQEQNSYIRVARLRLPYALEVQRVFSSDLTRVGMPVSPPIYEKVPLQMYTKDGTGQYNLNLPSISEGAVLAKSDDKEWLLFQVDTICEIRHLCHLFIIAQVDIMQNKLNNIDQATLPRSKEFENLTRSIAAKQKVLYNDEGWLKMLEPILVQSSENKMLGNNVGLLPSNKFNESKAKLQADFLILFGPVNTD